MFCVTRSSEREAEHTGEHESLSIPSPHDSCSSIGHVIGLSCTEEQSERQACQKGTWRLGMWQLPRGPLRDYLPSLPRVGFGNWFEQVFRRKLLFFEGMVGGVREDGFLTPRGKVRLEDLSLCTTLHSVDEPSMLGSCRRAPFTGRGSLLPRSPVRPRERPIGTSSSPSSVDFVTVDLLPEVEPPEVKGGNAKTSWSLWSL